MSKGLDPLQVSQDVGRAQGGGFGRVETPAPTAPEEALVALNAGRPQMWSPVAPSTDDLQQEIDAVARRIAEAETEVPYNGMLGVSPYNQRQTYLLRLESLDTFD